MSIRTNFRKFEYLFDAILYRKSGKYPYVGECDQSCDILYELCGVRASAGSVVVIFSPVLARSAVFVDGRYKLAAKITLDPSKFEILDDDLCSIERWIMENLPVGSRLAYDPRFFSIKSSEKLQKCLTCYCLVPVDLQNVLNLQQKKRSLNVHILPFSRAFAERSKWAPIYRVIEQNRLEAYLLCDPCSISWLLNIRDFDAQFSPVVFAYLLIKKGGETTIYLDSMYHKEAVQEKLTGIVGSVKFENDLANDLRDVILKNGGIVGIDPYETPSHILDATIAHSLRHIHNPCIAEKAVKSKAEIDGMKQAALADSAAITKVLDWVMNKIQKDPGLSITELDVSEQLEKFRCENPNYMGESFACISAADEHSAIIHYSPTLESNATIRNLLLLDTGGQYLYGTTDITRTIWVGVEEPPEDLKDFYTAVLRGHIAIARARFPESTCFAQLEPLARQFLWQKYADYPHSTSHGIGYVSCVHEILGPMEDIKERQRRTPLKPGMIISNEPGYYLAGRFGIRLENMLLVKEVEEEKRNEKEEAEGERYLEFETISWVPFDARLIKEDMLSEDEREWVIGCNTKTPSEI